MSDHSFDDLIRNSLSGYEAKKSPDWDTLKSRIEDQTDKAFDAMISRKLDNHRHEVKDNGWAGFETRYAHVRQLVAHIHSVKFIEAFCMLLLLFIMQAIDFPFATDLDYPQAQAEIKADKIIDTETLSADALESDEETLPSDFQTGVSRMIVRNIDSDVSTNSEISSGSTNGGHVQGKVSERFDDSRNRIEAVLPIAQKASANLIGEQANKAFQKVRINTVNVLPVEVKQPSLETNGPEIDIAPSLVFGQSFIKPLDSPVSRHIQVSASFDNNYIFTPDDLAYNTSARMTEMYGYSLDLLYSERRHRVEWATGLSFSSLDKPWNFNLQYGNSSGWYAFTMTNIHYKMVSVPLHMKYHLVANSDWSFYGLAGISNQFIVHSEYSTQNNYLGGGAIPVGSEPEIPEDAISPFEEERNFSKGLLEGGKLKDAYFLRAQIGAGIERYVGHSRAISVSGIYGRSIVNTTIGPNNDRLDRFSLAFGLKFRI